MNSENCVVDDMIEAHETQWILIQFNSSNIHAQDRNDLGIIKFNYILSSNNAAAPKKKREEKG